MDVNGCEWLMVIVNGYSWQLVGKTLVKRLGYWQIGSALWRNGGLKRHVWVETSSLFMEKYGKSPFLMGKSTMAIWKIANC
jgi:hypothetical protein